MNPAQEENRSEPDDSHYRLLFLQLPQPVLFLDPAGNICESNHAAHSRFGQGAPTGRPSSVHQLLTSDGAESLADLLATATRLPAGQVQTAPMRSTAAPALACTVQAFTLLGSGNSQCQIVLQLFDQSTNATLQRSDARFRLAQEATETGMWDWQLAEDRIEFDAMCWRLLGRGDQARAIDYASWQTMVHPDDLAEIERTYVEQVEHSGRFVTVGRYRKADGSWVWIQALGQVMERDRLGLPSRMVGTLTNIDTEHKAQLRSEQLLEQLNRLTEAMPGVVFQFHHRPDGHASLPYVSERFQAMTGLSAESVRDDASPFFERVYPDDLPGLMEAIALSEIALSRFQHAFRLRRTDGQLIWIGVTDTPVRQADGSTISYGYAADISERKALEHSLQQRHQRLDNILWGTGAGTWEWNAQSGETRLNEATASMLGYTLAEMEPVSSEKWLGLLQPDDRVRLNDELQRHLQGETDRLECELRLRHRNGHWVWVLNRGRICTRTAQGEPEWVMGIHLDISKRKAAEAELERLAHYDGLTGLARRPLLNEHIRQAISQARRHDSQLALLFLDLDGFKQINDVHGHAAGDRLLAELAQRMKSCLREVDTVARIGGDEFAALVVDLPERAAVLPLVQRLLETLALPVRHGALSMQVSASIGLTFYPQAQDAGPDELMQQADAAMYQAKRSGKNRYHSTDPIDCCRIRLSPA